MVNFFHSKIFGQRFLNIYRTLFSLEEIEQSKILQWFFGSSLLVFFVTFERWMFGAEITKHAAQLGRHACWPYFKNCGDWYFFSTPPDGYSQPAFYMLLAGMMVLAVFFMWKRKWVFAHIFLVLFFLWKATVMYGLSMSFNANFDHYHIILTFILLFFPFKIFFLKTVFVLFYFLSATVKFHGGWIAGTYFSALETGLPLFGNAWIPIWTNIVIFMQTVGVWFLFSSNKVLQRSVLIYFILFHLYSGILVGYRFPVTALPPLLILFGPLQSKAGIPFNKKSLAGWILTSALVLAQLIPAFIHGDQKLTFEGNAWGLHMFDANHQCISRAGLYFTDGTVERVEQESPRARDRCNPYKILFRLQQICEEIGNGVVRVEWQLDHSINGGPFYRIVNEKNACFLDYKLWGRNKWILLPEEGARIIGYPVQNFY